MEGPMSKKTKESPKRANQKGNIKFSNHFQSQEAYQIRKGEDLLKGCLAYKNPHLLQEPVSKQRLFAFVVAPLTPPSTYKTHTKLKEEGLQCLLLSTPCWHIDEKTYWSIGADIGKPLQLQEKTCPLGTDHDKNHFSSEL